MPIQSPFQTQFEIGPYDLDATLSSGQVFRWAPHPSGIKQHWHGPIGDYWIEAYSDGDSLFLGCQVSPVDWDWARQFFQIGVDIESMKSTFPKDDIMTRAVKFCPDLFILKQDPWECLASFILSSNKQITQIKQMVSNLCETYGKPLYGHNFKRRFPSSNCISQLSEKQLRDLKLGYRAPMLLESSKMVENGIIDLKNIESMDDPEARAELMKLKGVGPKIADCVLLFGFNRLAAFPIDTWIQKVLIRLYFQDKVRPRAELERFCGSYFGQFGGYAQQFLFHWIRTGNPELSKLARKAPIKVANL